MCHLDTKGIIGIETPNMQVRENGKNTKCKNTGIHASWGAQKDGIRKSGNVVLNFMPS